MLSRVTHSKTAQDLGQVRKTWNKSASSSWQANHQKGGGCDRSADKGSGNKGGGEVIAATVIVVGVKEGEEIGAPVIVAEIIGAAIIIGRITISL